MRISDLLHATQQLIKAYWLFEKDVQYVVKDGQIMIVDEFTGRMMPGRRWSDGLHQAVEAKEGVRVAGENQTLATVTFQNFFRMYDKLGGMTGTADTEAAEFNNIYKLDVVVVPTNQKMVRKDYPDVIYKTEREKYKAVVDEIKDLYDRGQPVLVGTITIEKSEMLNKMLKRTGIPHSVLNAKHHQKEAEIIANAGQAKTVTISTNMAGRGTDIVLGEGVRELGGLHILGTERHESRRIDNQLRGRAGRQGDAGSSRFYLSLDIRKHLLEYDDVMNKHREVIYSQRKDVLNGHGIAGLIENMIREKMEGFAEQYTDPKEHPENWDIQGLRDSFFRQFGFRPKISAEDIGQEAFDDLKVEDLSDLLAEQAKSAFQEKEKLFGKEDLEQLERFIILQIIDDQWVAHLQDMDQMKEGIGLRGYGQLDPLKEYQKEGFALFGGIMDRISDETLRTLSRLQLIKREPEQMPRRKNRAMNLSHGGEGSGAVTVRRKEKKVGRNEPCPCGSGKKYKRCCGAG